MEHSPLRPVPSRPPGPVDPEEATRHVASVLPELDPPAATALGLVALAGTPRQEAAEAADLSLEELGEALSRARKALRRSRFPLPGSGWCERAERLVSDRLDGALETPGPARLEVHLRNCPRCVEHERRLVQATDALVAAFASAPAPVAAAPAAAPPLSVVERSAARPLAALPFGEPIGPAPARVPLRPPVEPVAPEPEPPVVLPTPRPASAIAWSALLVFAVVLAVVAVALVVAGALGASL